MWQQTSHIVHYNGWNCKVYLTLSHEPQPFVWEKTMFSCSGGAIVWGTIFSCSRELLLCEEKIIFCWSEGEHGNATIYPTNGQVPSLRLDKRKGRKGERGNTFHPYILCLHTLNTCSKEEIFVPYMFLHTIAPNGRKSWKTDFDAVIICSHSCCCKPI